MTERQLRRDGFIWEVRRKLDEQYTCCRGEGQEGSSIKSVCPYYPLLSLIRSDKRVQQRDVVPVRLNGEGSPALTLG